jgi:hypothetical protein
MEYNSDKVRKITSEMLTALERLEDLQNCLSLSLLQIPIKYGAQNTA